MALPRDAEPAMVARRNRHGRGHQPLMTSAPSAAHEASLGFSTIEVVVSRNDTMDRLFRRLELNLARSGDAA